MPTLKNVNDSPTRRHIHPPATPIEETTERCPLCGQPVTKAQYSRIQKEIEAQVRARLEEAEKSLREGFQRRVNAEAAKAAEAQVKSGAGESGKNYQSALAGATYHP
jgi:hypothetical protein